MNTLIYKTLKSTLTSINDCETVLLFIPFYVEYNNIELTKDRQLRYEVLKIVYELLKKHVKLSNNIFFAYPVQFKDGMKISIRDMNNYRNRKYITEEEFAEFFKILNDYMN